MVSTEHLRLQHEPSPVRVAIVGSGPSGAYAADHLLKCGDAEVHVDMYERLPTPWGLVRSGVAPDHPKIKSVTRMYEKTAAHPRFSYFGNVALGRHVTREDLLARYSAVVYAVGTPSDRPMSIPGEDTPGSWAATDFVGWYNGHPDHRDHGFDLSCRRAVVIGNGNVALDVARMLTLGVENLKSTDIADHALEALAQSNIEEVVVVGRRGPEQAAFTNPELLELGELPGTDVVLDPREMEFREGLRDGSPDTAALRKLEILNGYAARAAGTGSRRIVLRFLWSPARVAGTTRVEGVELRRNELERASDGRLVARPTDRTEVLPAGLVLRAIGYRGVPLDGLPFDERSGVIPNDGGRIVGDGGQMPGEYVVGWAKRGPSGVIGTNKKDALETVQSLLGDLAAGHLAPPRSPVDKDAIAAFVRSRQPQLVELAGWQALDRHEQALGEESGRPRVKLTRVSEMLEALDRGRPDARLSA